MPSCYLCFAILMDFVCLHEWTSAITERKKNTLSVFFCGGKNFRNSRVFWMRSESFQLLENEHLSTTG